MGIRKFCRNIPIVEIVAGVVLIGLLIWAWQGVTPRQEKDATERSVGASTVSTVITGVLTVAGVMLSAALIGVSVGVSLLAESKLHIKWAVIFAVASLVAGTLGLTYLPSRVTHWDVTSDVAIAILGVLQFFFMVASGVRMVLAVLTVVR